MTLVLIVVGVVLVLLVVFFVGGIVISKRRRDRPDFAEHVRGADQMLEQARAQDKGWDKDVMEGVVRTALAGERPGAEYSDLHLVLVDDQPGVEEDRAHFMAVALGEGEGARVILTREPGGDWVLERIE
jgi:hypothetical protein